MNDRPIVGVLAAVITDHLLVDVTIHKTLCDKYIRGRVVAETYAQSSLDDVLKIWEQSFRQCKLCIRKLEKRQQ